VPLLSRNLIADNAAQQSVWQPQRRDTPPLAATPTACCLLQHAAALSYNIYHLRFNKAHGCISINLRAQAKVKQIQKGQLQLQLQIQRYGYKDTITKHS